MLDTIKKGLSSSQLRQLERFSGRLNEFGVSLAVCNADGELVLPCEGYNRCENSDKTRLEQLIEYGLEAVNRKDEQSCTGMYDNVCRLGEHNQVLAAVLRTGGQDLGAAVLCPANNEQSRYLSEMLSLFAEKFQAEAKAEEQIEMVSTELAQVYEELVLLHKLSTNMRITESDAGFLQMACDSLTNIVSVEGIAILLEKTTDEQGRLVLAAGSGLIDIDEQMAAVLHNHLAEEIKSGKEALLDSEVDSPFKYDWCDNVKNIIAVPLCGKDKTAAGFTETHNDNCIIGLMVAINRIDKPDFDSTDVKLFNSVANGCAVFIENGKLFKDLEELFIGSLKALTNSIDAKDQYTRGHSERVAFISRWIAERLAKREPLRQEQIHRIYLAGLLHDIGKIGIDESVLRKKGRLTEQEFDCIKTHPSIGAGILGEIKQMRDIVPGVLCHHERIDGKGYPNGLVGEQIPLIGKIIGLADSFDAMTSKRSYRDAMSVEQALAEIEKGLGAQFDEKIGRIFINSDVYHLWDAIRDGFTDSYGGGNFSEYGTMAVGTLIK